MTGTITDSSGAVVAGAQVNVTNQGTSELRTTTTDSNGYYIVPQLPPGIYDISIKKQGFATDNRADVQLQVNQNATLNFTLTVSSIAQTVKVTGAPPALNTTSATLGTVIGHTATVDLPLNGREFTQLTLLTPGVAPVETGQQGVFTVALGAGGISPSVNGQRGEQNNFTMDGTLNNSLFTNIWAISPPPDALQEFNVQSHITDAQFAISTGANINIVTRSGTNEFHGSLWEFVRNDALDANTFPATKRLPYTQNQYGVYLGGPVYVPHILNGKNNTWISGYWEGFRSYLSQTILTSTLTPNMIDGNFSGVIGKQVGIDSLGRPEYANAIYDPLTSRPDPQHPGEFLRDPFPGNIIPADRLNASSIAIIKKYYPLPNLNVPDGVLPNYQFTGVTSTLSDVFGVRLDHRFKNNDSAFIRFNRSNQHVNRPEDFPTYSSSLINYSQQAAVGYTHLFNPNTILEFHYGYTYTNILTGDEPAGAAFASAIGFSSAAPAHNGISLGPQVSITNGYGGVGQTIDPLGPMEGMDYHVDLSKTIGNHTLGVGAMYYHIRGNADGWFAATNFTQNATAQDGLAGPTGYGPASFILGTLNSYNPWEGNTGSDLTANWYGLYAQDQWQITKRLEMTVGLRWDYVSPTNMHKIISALNPLNGQFIVTGAVLPYYPKATGKSTLFEPQYNGYEPRFGLNYQIAKRTVLHGAFAILDDHNNTLIQESQNFRTSWPTAIDVNLPSLDLGIPQMYLNNLPLPSSFLGPNLKPYVGRGTVPNNKIPYSIEYNGGVQQQLSNSLVMAVDYVGSVSRHEYINPLANTAMTPGPGSILNREPFPQYGGPMPFTWNDGPASYNALQASLQKSLSSGLFFMTSYTWSKSLDWASDPYCGCIVNFYNLSSNWGPSDYNRTNMFVFSGVYALPIGRGQQFVHTPSRFLQGIVGNWNIGTIVSLHSGAPFNILAGSDISNTGDPAQRAQRTGANPYAAHQSPNAWLNTTAFTEPAQFTYGNEGRNDLTGPAYKDVDFDIYKNFPLAKRAVLEVRAEFFNGFNTTNYGNPVNNLQSPAFGKILGAAQGRVIQFAGKLTW